MMAVSVAAVEFDLAEEEAVLRRFRAAEAQEGFGVAVRHLVGPVATVGRRIEGETLRTIEHVVPAVDTVHELTALLLIADLEVAVLMRTVLRWICRLCRGVKRAVHYVIAIKSLCEKFSFHLGSSA